MEYRERHQLANKIKNDAFIEADKNLLKKHIPTSDLLHKSIDSCDTLAFELVFVLLDILPVAQIKENRKSYKSANSQGETPIAVTQIKKKGRSTKSSTK